MSAQNTPLQNSLSPASSSSPLKLASINIEAHRHLTERVLPFLLYEKPDVINLQEVFEVDVPLIKETLGMEGQYVALANVTETSIHTKHALGNWGLLQLSRLPMIEYDHAYYMGGPEKVPIFLENEPNSMNRAVQWLEVMHNGQRYRIANTHFIWSTHGDSTPLQLEKLDEMLRILEQFKDLIITGDFNAPRGKETFSRLAARYHDNIPPQVTTSIDGQFHKAGQLELMVDGFFSTPQYQVSEVRVEAGISDHKALVGTVLKINA